MGKSTSAGSSLTSMLLVLFITLKLTGVINWSWWWVLAPFWIPLSLAVFIFTIAKSIKNRSNT